MRYVIVGCGSIGLELARGWTDAGHEVTGTTTTPERIAELKEVCTEAVVLRGAETEKVQAVVRGADAVVMAVSPRLTSLLSRRERVSEFRESLVSTARSLAAVHRRVVLLSATIVYGYGYGDAADPVGDDPAAVVTELTRPTYELEPSAQGYASAERIVMESPDGAVLRLPFVYNQPGAPNRMELVRAMYARLNGETPLAAAALAYGIDYRDAAAAAAFVTDRGLSGVYNAVPDDAVPPTYEKVYRGVTDALGLAPATFRNEMKTPARPVSSAKLRAAGFSFAHGNAGVFARDGSGS